ncbi:hypothetical protein D3C77_243540 [compost metagenome]
METLNESNENEELVLRKIGLSEAIGVISLQLFSSGLIIYFGMKMNPENPMYKIFLALILLALMYTIFDLLLYRVTFTDKTIMLESIGGSRSINYSEIQHIHYKELGGGQFIIHSSDSKIKLMTKASGISEAINLLNSKGAPLCYEANKFLKKR